MTPFRLEKTLEEQCESKRMNQVEKVIKGAALHQGRRRPYSSLGLQPACSPLHVGLETGGLESLANHQEGSRLEHSF